MADNITDRPDPQGTERLGAALAQRAEEREHFIAHAFKSWRAHHQNQDLKDVLGCNDAALWRISVTPRPRDEAGFVEQTMKIATTYGANPSALVRVLRFAENVSAMSGHVESSEMLKAALDDDDEA